MPGNFDRNLLLFRYVAVPPSFDSISSNALICQTRHIIRDLAYVVKHCFMAVESGSQGLPSRFLPTVIGSLGSQTSLAKQPDGLSQEPAARMPRDGVCQQEICQLGQVSSSGMSALSQRDIDEVIMERAELQPKQCSYGIQDEHSISLLEVDNQMLQRLSGSLMEDMAYPSSAGQPKVNASGRIIGHILMDGLDASADSLEREQARLFGGDTIAAASLELIQPYESDSLARGSLHDVTREACQGASNECVTGSMSDFEEELGELKQAADRLQGIPSCGSSLRIQCGTI